MICILTPNLSALDFWKIQFELEKTSICFQTGEKIQYIKLNISKWRIGAT